MPARVNTALRFVQLVTGQAHTCGLVADGRAYCWGDNYFGQLGDGTSRNRATPTPVAQGEERFAWLGAGATHTCAVTTRGDVLCWGDDIFGAVTGGASGARTCPGGADARCVSSPYRLDIDRPLRTASGGEQGSCGLTADGGVYCWGGSMHNPRAPTLVHAQPPFESLHVGSSHRCALVADGGVYCRGSNDLGQLGTRMVAEATDDFVPVAEELTFRSLAADTFHTCGVTTDGVAYCWGSNREGALGTSSTGTCNGSHPCRTTPGRVRIG